MQYSQAPDSPDIARSRPEFVNIIWKHIDEACLPAPQLRKIQLVVIIPPSLRKEKPYVSDPTHRPAYPLGPGMVSAFSDVARAAGALDGPAIARWPGRPA